MQAVRPKIAQEVTQQQSLAMVQNLLRGSVSQISFLRNLFDEHNYRNVKIHTMQVRWLAKDVYKTEISVDGTRTMPGTSQPDSEAVLCRVARANSSARQPWSNPCKAVLHYCHRCQIHALPAIDAPHAAQGAARQR